MPAQSFPPFLLTRPLAASNRFAGALRERFGFDLRVTISPVMETVFLEPSLPSGRFDGLILTSETGAEAARRISAEQDVLPRIAYCVGDRTAAVAASGGFLPVSAQGNADALVALLRARGKPGRLLYLRGRHVQGKLAQMLALSQIETDEIVVYDQQPVPLTSDAKALLDTTGPLLLPVFSSRSADLIVAMGPFRAALWVAALSPAIAHHLAPLHPERLVVAGQPDAFHLIDAIDTLCVAGWQT